MRRRSARGCRRAGRSSSRPASSRRSGSRLEVECSRVGDERRRNEERARREEAGGVLAAVPVGADLLHVLAEHQVAGRDVVRRSCSRRRGPSRARGRPGTPACPMTTVELELPVVLVAVGGEHELDVVADDARRESDEEVRDALACSACPSSPPPTPAVSSIGRGSVLRPAGCDEVDDVGAVVRPGLQHLARFDRSGQGDVGEIEPASPVSVSAATAVEAGPRLRTLRRGMR